MMTLYLVSILLYLQAFPVSSNFVEEPEQNVIGFTGGSATFNWKLAVGDKTNLIKWSIGGTRIVLTQPFNSTATQDDINQDYIGRVIFTPQEAAITIQKLNLPDEGVVKCEVILINGVSLVGTSNLKVFVKPNFLELPPSSVTEHEFKNITVTCEIESKPPASLQWFKDDRSITTGGRFNITSRITAGTVASVRSTLMITKSERTDVGLYKCKANYESGRYGTEEKSSKITILFPATIVSFPSPRLGTIEFAQNFKIICDVEGSPLPAVSWLKSNVAITTNADFAITTSSITGQRFSSILTILSVKKEDFGNYTCIAVNTVPGLGEQTVQDMTTLVVTHKPYFVVKPDPETVVRNNTKVVFNCTVQASSKPNVTWSTNVKTNDRFKFRPSRTLVETEGKTIVEAILEVDNVRKEDYGIYRCNAVQGNLTSIENTTLLIEYSPIAHNIPSPRQIIRENSLDSLKCSVDSYPAPNITWMYSNNGENFIDVTSKGVVKKLPSTTYESRLVSEFKFEKNLISREEQGVYKCQIQNSIGMKEWESNITIEWPAEFDISSINGGITDVRLGKSATFKCIAKSKPVSSIKWLKNDITVVQATVENDLFSNSTTFARESLLTISDAQPDNTAKYACVAENVVAGTKEIRRREKTLNVIHAPILQVANSSIEVNISESFTMKCDAIANPDITHYLWKKDGVELANNQSELIIGYADKDTEAMFQCTPFNAEGPGGTVSHEVRVELSPTFTVLPTCERKDDIIYCTCNGVGYPQPSFQWHKDGSTQTLSTVNRLNLTISTTDEASYKCTLTNTNGVASYTFDINKIVVPVSDWNSWSACNSSCGEEGLRNRTRICNFLSCIKVTKEVENCTNICPTLAARTDDWHKDWYITFWILAPLLILLIIIMVLWLSRRKRDHKRAFFVPVNRYVSQPPSIRSIQTSRNIHLPEKSNFSAVNKGYDVKEVEPPPTPTPYVPKNETETDTIEVEMHFEDDEQGQDIVNQTQNNSLHSKPFYPIPEITEQDYDDPTQPIENRQIADGDIDVRNNFNESDLNDPTPAYLGDGFLSYYDEATPTKPPRLQNEYAMSYDNQTFQADQANGFV